MNDPNYECPWCGTHDRNRYVRCDHPGCPDGHDQPERFRGYSDPDLRPYDQPAPGERKRCRIFGMIVLVLIAFGAGVLLARSAPAAERPPVIYQAPDEEQYYSGLRQPDFPSSGCCGWGDAYYADKTDACGPDDRPTNGGEPCKLVAIITDTRPDERIYVRDNGTSIKITRPHIPVGTRISIPDGKLRRKPVANPTDHNIVFVNFSEYGSWVYCWETVSGL